MEWEYDLDERSAAAETFWKIAGGRRLFAFHGNLGSGKTTFIHALCDRLGVTDPVGSPTFSIINQYEYGSGCIYHIDLYRVANEEEAARAGVEDCLYSGCICFVEWPEKAPAIFPEDTVHIYLDVVDERTRRIRMDL